MQPSPGTGLPHTRSRPLHWLVTATAVVAILGAAALVQPPGAAAGDGKPLSGPPADAARYPVDCVGTKPVVYKQAAADLDHDGRTETVAVVRCRTAMSTPPSGIFVVSGAAAGDRSPRVTETLLHPRSGMSIGDFAVRESAISATLLGYSSPDVPRCCPDKRRGVTWEWHDGRFELTAEPVAGTQA